MKPLAIWMLVTTSNSPITLFNTIYNSNIRQLKAETEADSTHANAALSTVYMRLEKSGTTYTGYHSDDGVIWVNYGSITDTSFPIDSGSVGFYGGKTWDSTPYTGLADYFREVSP